MLQIPYTDTEKLKLENIEIIKLDADPKSKRENYIKSYLIVSPNTRVLVETGPRNAFEVLKDSVESKGFKLSEVDYVLLTHIHLDHAGGLAEVLGECNCPAYVHPKGLKHLVDPSKLNEAARKALGEEVFSSYGPASPVKEEMLRPTEDGQTLRLGEVEVKVVFTPGHAPHHQALLAGGVLFPGDALGEVTTWKGAYTPTTPHRTIISAMIDSINKLMDLEPLASAYTHRGFVVGKENVLLQMAGEAEQLRTWLHTIMIRAAECGGDVWCHFEHLKRVDPMLRLLEEEIEASSLLKNSIRMSIDGIYKYALKVS